MKTEQEIRTQIAVLRELVLKPCDCLAAGVGHAFKCLVGGHMMTAAADGMEWALNDPNPSNPNFASFMERMLDDTK